MKVVFLDVDGVLNSAAYLYAAERAWPEGTPFEGNQHLELDPPAVARLNRIVRESGAKVVISSSWRFGNTPAEMQEILRRRGFEGEVVGDTPRDGHGAVRGLEIQAWLDGHPGVESFVILDDDSDMAHLAPRHVRTRFSDGLLDEHVDAALAALAR